MKTTQSMHFKNMEDIVKKLFHLYTIILRIYFSVLRIIIIYKVRAYTTSENP